MALEVARDAALEDAGRMLDVLILELRGGVEDGELPNEKIVGC